MSEVFPSRAEPQEPPVLVRVRVLRSFRIAGERINAGSVVDLEQSLAAELGNANRVELVAADEPLVAVTDADADAAWFAEVAARGPLAI